MNDRSFFGRSETNHNVGGSTYGNAHQGDSRTSREKRPRVLKKGGREKKKKNRARAYA